MNRQKPNVRIDDWAVVPRPNTASFRELTPGNLLVGKVFGHPKMHEGALIFTSPVVRVDAEHQIVETKNTAYVLGRANIEYKAWSRDHGVAA